MSYEPIGNRILVEVTKVGDKTEGGIVLPESAKAREGKTRLRVVATGPLVDGVVVGNHVLVSDAAPFPVIVPSLKGGPERYIVDMEIVVAIDRSIHATADGPTLQ